jgi:hypothetical protein
VTGEAISPDFPTTAGAFKTTGFFNAFVTKLNPTGSLVYSTYLGGSGTDFGWGIAVDATGNAYVTGQTDSTNFSTTPGAFRTALAGGNDAFVAKIGDAIHTSSDQHIACFLVEPFQFWADRYFHSNGHLCGSRNADRHGNVQGRGKLTRRSDAECIRTGRINDFITHHRRP